jgi:ABC-2 type transporter
MCIIATGVTCEINCIFYPDYRTTQVDLLNSLGSMYLAALLLGIQNSATVMPVVSVERTVFYRERAAGMYSALPYAFGQVHV